MAAGTLANTVLCILRILFSNKRKKRHLIWHTEEETCFVGSLSLTCEERVGREPVALDWEAAASLGEMSSSSARQAGRQPRAEKENHPPPCCYRGTLKGLRMADFYGCYVQPENKQIVADNSRNTPFNTWRVVSTTSARSLAEVRAAGPQRLQAVCVCDQYNNSLLNLGTLHPMTVAPHHG